MVPPDDDPLKGPALLGPVNLGTYWLVVLDGRVVPHIKVFSRGERFFVSLDDRMGIEATSHLEILNWMQLVANAMALSAGYAQFGSNDRHNPYNTMIAGGEHPKASTSEPPPPPSHINAKPSLRLVESKPPPP